MLVIASVSISSQSNYFDRFALADAIQVRFVGLRHYSYTTSANPLNVFASKDIGISRVELYIDQVLVGTANLIPAQPVVNASFNWQATGNGKHMLQAKAVDVLGNFEISNIAVIVRNPAQTGPTPTPTPSPSPTPTSTPTPTPSPTPPIGNTITLNPSVRYQTMRGWEATDQAGQLYSAGWNNYKGPLLDQAVNDLGINRVRLEITSGAENPIDHFAQWRAGQISESQYNARRYEIVNDNADPNVTNPSGFKWSQLDSSVNSIVLPLRQRLAARGESLWVNVDYVDFGSSAFEHKSSPAEYAEFVLATYQHLQGTFGFVPDSWEVILEPDTSTANWSATQVAQAIKAAGDRLAANGFTPNFTAPSTTNGSNAPVFIDVIAQTSGAMQYVGEFSYHRYCCVFEQVLENIASRAVQYNKQSAMLEWIGADRNTLHEDLKLGRVSSWQQFTLAGPANWGPDNGDRYYIIDDSNASAPVITMGSRTRFLRQYFKYVRRGAVRIDAQSGDPNFDPVAFINSNGKYVLVVKSAAGGSFNVQGLPAGTYGIKYTTASQYNIDLADFTVSAGQALATNIPSAGVITIYQR